VKNLEVDEKPALGASEQRILEGDDIRKLLDKMPAKYDPIFRTAVFTGLRLGELLGLKWQDVDLARGVIRVRRQLTQQGELAEPKTRNAKREVVVFPDLGCFLREHRLRSALLDRRRFRVHDADG
jgi:integrase